MHCEPMHVRRANSADEARETASSLLPRLLLLALPFDAADRIFALRWRRRLSRSLEFLCALAGDLKDAVTRHRLDQELGQPPHQRIEAVRRVACPSPIKVRLKAHI